MPRKVKGQAQLTACTPPLKELTWAARASWADHSVRSEQSSRPGRTARSTKRGTDMDVAISAKISSSRRSHIAHIACARAAQFSLMHAVWISPSCTEESPTVSSQTRDPTDQPRRERAEGSAEPEQRIRREVRRRDVHQSTDARVVAVSRNICELSSRSQSFSVVTWTRAGKLSASNRQSSCARAACTSRRSESSGPGWHGGRLVRQCMCDL